MTSQALTKLCEGENTLQTLYRNQEIRESWKNLYQIESKASKPPSLKSTLKEKRKLTKKEQEIKLKEISDVIHKFSLSYTLDRPRNVIDYAVEYFTGLRDKRNISALHLQKGRPTSPQPKVSSLSKRKSFYATSYNPLKMMQDTTPRIVYPKTVEQRQHLSDYIKKVFVLTSLDDDQIREVVDAMFEQDVEEGKTIIKQGDQGDYFYVIAKGQFNVYVNDEDGPKVIRTYDGSGYFGELALLYNQPRAASVVAASDGVLWALAGQTFRRIIIISAVKRNLKFENYIDSVPMLKPLDKSERVKLVDCLVLRSYEDGQFIFREGDKADGVYFVEEGAVRITKFDAINEVEVHLKTIPKNGYFGELGLLTSKPRAASANAVGNVKLAFLGIVAFERILGPCLDVMNRNTDEYGKQMSALFGSTNTI